jgi:hypothetical protein
MIQRGQDYRREVQPEQCLAIEAKSLSRSLGDCEVWLQNERM